MGTRGVRLIVVELEEKFCVGVGSEVRMGECWMVDMMKPQQQSD